MDADISAADAPESLVARVTSEVIGHMRAQRLEPGAALPSEASFAASAGASRAVVREAFRGLAALRLIDIGNGRRARVAATDASVLSVLIDHALHTRQFTIQQLLDVRRTIEQRSVALAAMRRTEAEAADIAGIAAAMRDRFDHPAEVMEHDIAFHEAIAKASRNPLFALLVGAFRVATRETWAVGWSSRPSDAARMDSVAVHAAIATAIAERDPRRAARTMAEHFDLTIKALLNAGVT